MFATPKFTAVTCGCVAGVVCPAAIAMFAGDTATLELSLLTSVMITPPGGAGEGNETGKGNELPRPKVMLDGKTIGAALTTVTPAVLSGAPAALAWMVAVPGATPVTGTTTLVANAPKLTLPGTVAIVVSLELRYTVNPPAGAGDGRLSVKFCVLAPVIVRDPGTKAMFTITCMVRVPEVYPGAKAVIVAVPALTPVAFGSGTGLKDPTPM